MSAPEPEAPTRTEVVNEASAWLAGGGMLTMALAPLALPFLILTVVFVLPLLLLPLVPLLLVALVVLPVVVVVRLMRRALDVSVPHAVHKRPIAERPREGSGAV